jgi:hypothetical protein
LAIGSHGSIMPTQHRIKSDSFYAESVIKIHR